MDRGSAVRSRTAGILSFVLVYLAIAIVARNFSAASVVGGADDLLTFVIVAVLISLLVGAASWMSSMDGSSTYKKVFVVFPPALILAVGIFNVLSQAKWFKSYGDSGELEVWVSTGRPFGRWLAGTTLLVDGYAIFKGFVYEVAPQTFVLLASTIVMGVASISIPKIFGRSAMVILPLMTPIWIAMSVGYDEYYPFIAGVYLATSLWLFSSRPVHPTIAKFALIAALPALYVGFIPLAGFALWKLGTGMRSVQDWLKGVFVTFLAYLVIVELSWPSGHSNYLATIHDLMSLGNLNNGYRGDALSENSPFFSLGSVLTLWHLEDLIFCGLMAGGIATAILLSGIGWRSIGLARVTSFRIRSLLSQTAVRGAFLGWNLFYFVFMIPKLGPVTDIDLFFMSNIVIAIFAGYLLDRKADELNLSPATRRKWLAMIASLNGPFNQTEDVLANIT
jgi:hypothetical protein